MDPWAAVAMVAGWLASVSGAPACALELFRVARSTNANVVLYEARTQASGALDPLQPIQASWLMLAQDGRREDLSFLERSLAYGFEVQAATSPDAYRVTLAAQPDRALFVLRRGGCPVAVTTIDGREAVLRIVFVRMGDGLVPGVRSVDLVGEDLATGEDLHEVLEPPAPADPT